MSSSFNSTNISRHHQTPYKPKPSPFDRATWTPWNLEMILNRSLLSPPNLPFRKIAPRSFRRLHLPPSAASSVRWPNSSNLEFRANWRRSPFATLPHDRPYLARGMITTGRPDRQRRGDLEVCGCIVAFGLPPLQPQFWEVIVTAIVLASVIAGTSFLLFWIICGRIWPDWIIGASLLRCVSGGLQTWVWSTEGITWYTEQVVTFGTFWNMWRTDRAKDLASSSRINLFRGNLWIFIVLGRINQWQNLKHVEFREDLQRIDSDEDLV